MGINHERLYECLTNEALINNLIELTKESDKVLKFSPEFDKYYKRINMLKLELLKRMSK